MYGSLGNNFFEHLGKTRVKTKKRALFKSHTTADRSIKTKREFDHACY